MEGNTFESCSWLPRSKETFASFDLGGHDLRIADVSQEGAAVVHSVCRISVDLISG
jgi:hypothetical protein